MRAPWGRNDPALRARGQKALRAGANAYREIQACAGVVVRPSWAVASGEVVDTLDSLADENLPADCS
jgi:hypothetical protein